MQLRCIVRPNHSCLPRVCTYLDIVVVVAPLGVVMAARCTSEVLHVPTGCRCPIWMTSKLCTALLPVVFFCQNQHGRVRCSWRRTCSGVSKDLSHWLLFTFCPDWLSVRYSHSASLRIRTAGISAALHSAAADSENTQNDSHSIMSCDRHSPEKVVLGAQVIPLQVYNMPRAKFYTIQSLKLVTQRGTLLPNLKGASKLCSKSSRILPDFTA